MSSPYDAMERLIDKYGVADVILMINDICDAKAHHISASYGDEGLSNKWLRVGTVMRKAVRELPKVSGIK